jgi:hypothetical protein
MCRCFLVAFLPSPLALRAIFHHEKASTVLQFVEYGLLECSVELQAAGSESVITGRLGAASPASSGLSEPPPPTSYVPPEPIVSRVRSRRRKVGHIFPCN